VGKRGRLCHSRISWVRGLLAREEGPRLRIEICLGIPGSKNIEFLNGLAGAYAIAGRTLSGASHYVRNGHHSHGCVSRRSQLTLTTSSKLPLHSATGFHELWCKLKSADWRN
jgi:hypothetical protein